MSAHNGTTPSNLAPLKTRSNSSSPPKLKPDSPRAEPGAKALMLRNSESATITFKLKEEGEDFKVIEMTVKPAATKK